ncbi:PREDICTED: dopamine N-acetyltransferase-like [Nicrophorus vespilloides]|uniref:Dopamine N-acetyltransferase-like n=1 Tax=Nicrophorus vespilloides TaxID=110193 RepID=A0ABM1M4E7_NICVS|nr:PREDICTED: dopamine N-acetyltransferase-like [Nicrophorus vespilloides]
MDDPFIVTRAATSEACDILDLMWDAYYPDEPTTSFLGLGRNRNSVFDDQALKVLAQGYSIVARCKYNGSLVGASLNSITVPWDPKMTEKFACTLSDDKMTKLFMFFAYLQKVPRLWERYCDLQVFEMANVFVRRSDRRKGVAGRLVRASRDLAADTGFRIVRVDATNVHTATLCDRLKMRMVYELPYCSYLGEDNNPVIDPPKPNTSVKVYIDTPLSWTN